MLGTCAHSFAAHEASAITSGERTIGRMACLGAGESMGETVITRSTFSLVAETGSVFRLL